MLTRWIIFFFRHWTLTWADLQVHLLILVTVISRLRIIRNKKSEETTGGKYDALRCYLALALAVSPSDYRHIFRHPLEVQCNESVARSSLLPWSNPWRWVVQECQRAESMFIDSFLHSRSQSQWSIGAILVRDVRALRFHATVLPSTDDGQRCATS